MREKRHFVTVVSGLPRSGTSLMMQMLLAAGILPLSDGVREPDEDNPRGYFELEAVKATLRDAGWVAQAPGRAVKVIHALLAGLPAGYEYRVVVLRRPIAEVMESQRRMLVRLGRPPAAGSGDSIARILESQLERAVQALRERARTAVLEVDYPRLVAAPREVVLRVDAFLDGGLDVDAMVARVDPALYRSHA